jgi:hypothetical protein
MRRISIDNPGLDNTYITDIAVDYSTGTALTTRSNNSFANNDLAVFGNPGEELTEAKKIASLSGATGFVLASTLNFAHNKGTPVYKTLWDFVSIEADYGAGWVTITSSPIQWDSKTNKTLYFDTNGTGATSYRFRFYNSATLTFSEYSPTLTGAGYAKNQMGYIIREAREIVGDEEGKIMSTTECLRILTRAKNIIRAHNARYWFWKVDGYNSDKTILATADASVYDLSSLANIGPVDTIEYRLTQGSMDEKWVLLRISDAEMRAKTRYVNNPASNYPRSYRLLPPDDNSLRGYFEIDRQIKDSNVGTFYVSFYQEEDDYNSVDDTTKIIMPEILQDYLISKIYARKGNETLAKTYYEQFTGPENKKKTSGIDDLTGIALLDGLDTQYKRSQGQPMSLKRFRGQKAMSRLYGSRGYQNRDQQREDFFDGDEG